MKPTKDTIEFGKRLSTLRNAKDLSKTDVAKHLSMPQSTYSGYELGTRKVTVPIIRTLADFFGVSPDYLITGEKANSRPTNTERAKLLDKIQQLNEKGCERVSIYVEGLLASDEYKNTDRA